MNAYEMTHVLVARLDIPERTVLKQNMVEALSLPRKFMQQDSFEVNSPSDISLISNLVTRVRIPQGDQITQSSLISISAKAGLSVKIPPGYRGAILPINPAMRDLIKPGDHVDVLVTFEGKATFRNFMGLKLDLEDLFGRRVDLLTPRCLSPEMRDEIDKEALLAP